MFLPSLPGNQGFYEDITAGEYYVEDKWEFRRALRDLARCRARAILDIGCGSGFFLDRLKSALTGVDAQGYEFNPKTAEATRAKGHVVHAGPFPDVIPSNPGFDAVCLIQVLEHLANPVEVLGQVRSLLKPGGVLIVSVPDTAGPIRHFPTAVTEVPPHHVSRWCATAFRLGMPRLGFRVCDVAFEPLPHYLWDAYLPRMLECDFGINRLGRLLNRLGVTATAIRLLRRAGVKWLHGVRGHTIYVVLRPDDGETLRTRGS